MDGWPRPDISQARPIPTSASGIGFAVVRRLLREGASVLAVDINAGALTIT